MHEIGLVLGGVGFGLCWARIVALQCPQSQGYWKTETCTSLSCEGRQRTPRGRHHMACDCGCVWLGQHKGRWLGCVGESVGGWDRVWSLQKACLHFAEGMYMCPVAEGLYIFRTAPFYEWGAWFLLGLNFASKLQTESEFTNPAFLPQIRLPRMEQQVLVRHIRHCEGRVDGCRHPF